MAKFNSKSKMPLLGKIGSKPCDYVTLSEDTWGEFDGFTHMGLK